MADTSQPIKLSRGKAAWEVLKFLGTCLIGFATVSVLMWLALVVLMGLSIAAM